MAKSCSNCWHNENFSDVMVNGVMLRDPSYCQKADEMLHKFSNAIAPLLDDRDVNTATNCPYWEDAGEDEE